jgi:hypothetical protein
MSRRTKSMMGKVVRRLNAYVNAEGEHCGHESGIARAEQLRRDFLAYVRDMIDDLDSQVEKLRKDAEVHQ